MAGSDDVIDLIAGKPLGQVVTVTDAKNIWPELDDLEVRAQLRSEKNIKGRLIADLHDNMTWDFVDNDLVITLGMTGEQTKALYSLRWGYFKTAYFNVIVSDVGSEDARAIVVPVMTLKGYDTTTSSMDVT